MLITVLIIGLTFSRYAEYLTVNKAITSREEPRGRGTPRRFRKPSTGGGEDNIRALTAGSRDRQEGDGLQRATWSVKVPCLQCKRLHNFSARSVERQC